MKLLEPWPQSNDFSHLHYRKKTANNACNPDYERGQAPEGWCQHRIAAGIDKRTREMLAAQAADITLSDGTAAPQAPLPEAPASVNVRVLVGGHEVQWTLRDTDEGRLAERLQALLKRPDIRPVPKPAPRSQQWRKGGQHG